MPQRSELGEQRGGIFPAYPESQHHSLLLSQTLQLTNSTQGMDMLVEEAAEFPDWRVVSGCGVAKDRVL